MEKLKERLKRVRMQDILLWLMIAALLFLTLQASPPQERWERGRRILLLTVLICWFNRSRKK